MHSRPKLARLVAAATALLGAGLLAPSPARAEGSPFVDLPADHWAYPAVQGLVSKGILSGYPDGSFRGNNLVTRYALAVSLAKAMEGGALAGKDRDGQKTPLSMQDLDTLERLIKEFGDELALVGVKTAAIEEQIKAQARSIEDLDRRVVELETGEGGKQDRVRFLDGRVRALAYNKAALDGSLDAIVNVGFDVNKDVDARIGLRYRNIFDQIDNERFGTYEAYLRSKKPVGPVDEVKFGKFNQFLGAGLALYDLREGLQLKSSRNDVDFELSYFDALMAHVSTEVLDDGRLGFYWIKQDRTGNRRPEHLGVYTLGKVSDSLDYAMEFTQYDNDGPTPGNRDVETNSFYLGVGFKPNAEKATKLRLGWLIQGEDYRAMAVDSDLRWQFPDMRLSPHHDVLQALRDATPAGIDPDELAGFRDLKLGVDLAFADSPWKMRMDLDMLRSHTSSLNHADDEFDVFTLFLEREMGEGLDFQVRYQALSFDNENGAATVDAQPALRRQDMNTLRAQVVKRF